jgi:Predicted membrane-bound metal-dependent hydrolases
MQKRYHVIVSSAGALATASLTHPHLLWTSQMTPNMPGVAVALVGGVLAAAAPDIDIYLRPILRHRTLTHSLLGLGIFAAGLGVLGEAVQHWLGPGLDPALMPMIWLFLFCLVYSCVFHILADMTTRSGVPLFYPFRQTSYYILPYRMRISTGRALTEGLLAYVMAALVVGVAFAARYGALYAIRLLA